MGSLPAKVVKRRSLRVPCLLVERLALPRVTAAAPQLGQLIQEPCRLGARVRRTEGGQNLSVDRLSLGVAPLAAKERRQAVRRVNHAAGGGAGCGAPERESVAEEILGCSRGEAIAGFSVLFGGLGAGVGALVKSDRWAKVTLSATPQVQRRGLGLAIALRF